VVLTEPAVYITQFFRGIQDDVYDMWNSKMLALGFQRHLGFIYKPWFIPASSQVKPTVKLFNERRMPFQLFLSRGLQTSWDFNRLFTNSTAAGSQVTYGSACASSLFTASWQNCGEGLQS
jgi:hypothetical protein